MNQRQDVAPRSTAPAQAGAPTRTGPLQLSEELFSHVSGGRGPAGGWSAKSSLAGPSGGWASKLSSGSDGNQA